jgi:hypothetical protein
MKWELSKHGEHFEFNDNMNVSTQGSVITSSDQNSSINTDTTKYRVSKRFSIY